MRLETPKTPKISSETPKTPEIPTETPESLRSLSPKVSPMRVSRDSGGEGELLTKRKEGCTHEQCAYVLICIYRVWSPLPRVHMSQHQPQPLLKEPTSSDEGGAKCARGTVGMAQFESVMFVPCLSNWFPLSPPEAPDLSNAR